MENIILLPSAKETYSEILQDLPMDAAIALDDKVEALFDKLRKFTNLCPRSSKISSLRRCIVDINISLVYSSDNDVHIIAFYYNKGRVDF